MARDSDWLPLADVADRLSSARSIREDEAKLEICAAIAGLRLRIRAHDGGNQPPTIAEINDIEIPDELTPDRVDWALSRPALLFPWRTRSADGWKERRLTLVEALFEDFTTELCRDVSSVSLPHRQRIPAEFVTYPDRLKYARELARSEWSPCHGTIDEVSCLVGNIARKIPLSQALSTMAFGSAVDPVGLDEVELVALRQQAAWALCHAALEMDITMFGSRLRPSAVAQPISEILFKDLPRLGDAPNSLVRDHEGHASRSRSVRHGKSEHSWHGEWFHVEVDVPSFVEWLKLSISSARKKQLGRELSRRLFEYPFWSIETVLCWITVRDASRLQERPDTDVELQAEMRLLRLLKDGKLRAQVNWQVLPCGYWADHVPIVGDLGTPIAGELSGTPQSLCFPREDVLRIFPDTLTGPCSYVRARRQARIDRIVQRMRATRQWIGVVIALKVQCYPLQRQIRSTAPRSRLKTRNSRRQEPIIRARKSRSSILHRRHQARR